MKAVVFHAQGGVDKLRYEEVPDPVISASEILVKVYACAVNHLDIRARRDRPEVQPFPHILGSDIAGEVVEIGAEVHKVAVGDSVVLSPCIPCGECVDCLNGDENLCDSQILLGFQTNGGYAQYVTAPAENAIILSSRLSCREAAAMPMTYLTAWHMLVTRAGIRPGDDVLILSAGSGVGSAGLQIAKLCGARVFVTASTDEKLERARQMGADFAINYNAADFSEIIREETADRGVDVVFEHVGTETWDKSIACLANKGRLVSCGVTAGNMGTIDIRKMYQKELTLLGSALGTTSELRTVMRLAEQGDLSPIIDRVLPLHQAAEAHRIMEARKNFGKICLSPVDKL
ncbi:MAG: zinc-binding dehydrogenase [Candidatus Poribacteria bacterium]|nr:zinc-binding dehydrogenase [Candidatus Poribacteria bacterium]MDE0502665.1 zinc-binding dehydrogenase [Candidatus Poribacteria bacterium]